MLNMSTKSGLITVSGLTAYPSEYPAFVLAGNPAKYVSGAFLVRKHTGKDSPQSIVVDPNSFFSDSDTDS
jgi:hypothetical protein